MGLAILFTLVPQVLRALPGDAAAVLAHCGPATDDRTIKPTNGPQERIITYNNLALRFQPFDGDWSYFAASSLGVPIASPAAVKSLPCLGDALEEVAARPVAPAAAEPAEVATQPAANRTETTNNLFLLAVAAIVAGILFFAIWPYTKARPRKPAAREPFRSPTRKPSSERIAVRPPKPADPLSPITRRAAAPAEAGPPDAPAAGPPAEEE